ncbi:MAG: F0F1 ATP synthase subunit B [Candidatus Omnitrophica bacterium]|nr:F0F1 ATP synthase subunit B [Candidatus Omnitrophota bacterium]
MELLKLLSANEIIAQILSFLLLLFILRAFAWKKILKLLDDRKARIESEFKRIEDAKKAVEVLKEEYESKLHAIGEEAKSKIAEAIASGEKLTEEIRRKAYDDAQDIVERARDGLKHELAIAREGLKEQIIDLTIKAAEEVIREKLTEEGDRKLVADFLERVEGMK